MIGNPKYKEGNIVHFKLTLKDRANVSINEKDGFQLEPVTLDLSGEVYIVDAYGTFEQNEEPSYDIMVEDWRGTGEPMLVKHIRESGLIEYEDEVYEDN